MAYATPANLADLLAPDPAPANAVRLLARASRVIDGAILCAVYDVDSGGLPTDTVIATALEDATCEQAAHWIESGNDEGIAAGYTSVSIGSIGLSGGTSAADGGSTGEACPQAFLILQRAGLTGHGPQAC